MTTHMFVDETKAKAYVVVAIVCPAPRVSEVRRTLRQLVLPGQRSLHMKDEGSPRRRIVADALTGLAGIGVEAIVLDSGRGPESELERRGRCLDAIGSEAVRREAKRIVFDLDETVVSFDRRRLRAAIPSSVRAEVTYEHARRDEEQLLALPDPVAWCWARGGEWRGRIPPLIADVREVWKAGPGSAKPERRVRPDGSRAHFPAIVLRAGSSMNHGADTIKRPDQLGKRTPVLAWQR